MQQFEFRDHVYQTSKSKIISVVREVPILCKVEIYLFSWRKTDKIVHISADFARKKSDRIGNINLEGWKTKIFNQIITDIRNNKF